MSESTFLEFTYTTYPTLGEEVFLRRGVRRDQILHYSEVKTRDLPVRYVTEIYLSGGKSMYVDQIPQVVKKMLDDSE